MGKTSIKLQDDILLDSSAIVHNKQTIDKYIANCYIAGAGHAKLLNGLIIQWGSIYYGDITSTEVNKTVTFTKAFPNSCFNVQLTLSDAGYGVTRFTTSVGLANYSKTGFTANFKSTTDKNATTQCTLYWFAIGY